MIYVVALVRPRRFSRFFIILVETWLNDSICDNELGLNNNFKIFRIDKNLDNNDHSRVKGAFRAVRDCWFHREMKMSVNCVEQLFVNVRIGHKQIIINISIYFPLNSHSVVYESHCRAIKEASSLSPNADLLIADDFNLPNINWKNQNDFLIYDVRCCHMTEQANIILHYYNEFNFSQFIIMFLM